MFEWRLSFSSFSLLKLFLPNNRIRTFLNLYVLPVKDMYHIKLMPRVCVQRMYSCRSVQQYVFVLAYMLKYTQATPQNLRLRSFPLFKYTIYPSMDRHVSKQLCRNMRSENCGTHMWLQDWKGKVINGEHSFQNFIQRFIRSTRYRHHAVIYPSRDQKTD